VQCFLTGCFFDFLPLNLLLVRSYQAEIIIVKRLIQGRNKVVMNKCFLLNPEKKLAQIRFVLFEKNAKNAPLILKNDVTEPKVRLLQYQLNC